MSWSAVSLALAASLAAIELPAPAYDAAVPTSTRVLGYDWGAQISSPEALTRYLEALVQAAPRQARLLRYGASWEGRPLQVLAIGTAERLDNLEALLDERRALSDPRALDRAAGERLVARQPVVVWLMHSVHGNEVSSSDAALLTAYHLLAARGDERVETILRECVVLIDPLQNPDGRARFLAHYELTRGTQPDPDPASVEHDEPWPGGRGNHYLFDLNRDWLALTQPETRARAALFRRWLPQVVVDLHEMGGESSYYFPPPAEPLNPHLDAAQRAALQRVGQAIAREFDARGWAYFNREVYDAFYPGYGESWALFKGALGMTFEQASARGLVYRRLTDDTLLHYRDGVERHFTASLATLAAAAAERTALLRGFLDYRRAAAEAGQRGEVREYALPPGHDPARTARLVGLLLEHDVEVRRTLEPWRGGPGEAALPAGTFLVSLAQPAGRLVRNLLEPHVPLEPAFVSEQDRRRKRREPDEIYDVTAWSLPLAFDVECLARRQPATVRSETLRPGTPLWQVPEPAPARVAYLADWGVGAVAAAAEGLAAGLRLRFTAEPVVLSGRRFAAGALLARVSENDAALRARLQALGARHGVDFVALDSAFSDEGVSLGSRRVPALRLPRVALLWGEPGRSLSAGWARWLLEQRYGQALTLVRLEVLGQADLRRFDVLVLPAGDYGEVGERTRTALKAWVAAGGTLVALGDAARSLARPPWSLLAARPELRGGRTEGGEAKPSQDAAPGAARSEPEKAAAPFDLERALQPEDERPEVTPGALLRVDLDRSHWLAAGSDGQIAALVEGRRVFSPLRLDQGRNVGLYTTADNLVASGLVWAEARAQLAQKAFLMHQPVGEGHLVAFAEDPGFRGFAEATGLLFLNAVLLGPAH